MTRRPLSARPYLLGICEVADSTLQSIFETVLGWYLNDGDFAPAITAMVPNIVKATLGIYTACLEGLLPTPSKSHYTFNLRDLARVVQGMMLMSKESMPEGEEGEAGRLLRTTTRPILSLLLFLLLLLLLLLRAL